MHSPFVFDLITSVIKEKAVYYDFERIEAMGNIREKERKLYRLLFRLAEYFSYRNVLCVGVRSPWVSMYLAAVSKHISPSCKPAFAAPGPAETDETYTPCGKP